MILEKTWMNKINLVIDMQINFLWFSNFNSTSQKSIALFSSNKLITKRKSLTFTHILKRFFTFITSQFSQNKKFIEQLKSRNTTLINVNSKLMFSLKSLSFSSMNIVIIETATYKMLVKWSDIKIFAIIVLKIDWLIIIIINSYTLVTSIRLTHERLYAMCVEWTKLSEIENRLLFIQLLHAVETIKLKLCIKFVRDDCMLKNECSCHFKVLQQLRFHHHSCCCLEILRDWDNDSIVCEVDIL